jgi:hypothetical protein
MPLIELRRKTPLSPRERSLLPGGCEVVEGEPGILARSRATLPLPQLLQLAVAMGRAVPDAKLHVEEDAGTEPVYDLPKEDKAPKTAEAAVQAVTAPRRFDDHGHKEGDAANPWTGLDLSDLDRAAAPFVGKPLDGPGRDRVRTMLRSTDPRELALACRIARVSDWRSVVQSLRPCLRHADTRVRLEAVLGLAALGGPAVLLSLRPLTEDPAPEVREAAITALQRA